MIAFNHKTLLLFKNIKNIAYFGPKYCLLDHYGKVLGKVDDHLVEYWWEIVGKVGDHSGKDR